MAENTVENLLGLSFVKLSLTEKVQIKERGRVTPHIDLRSDAVSHGKVYSRKFDSKYFEKYTWLTACPTRNRLFCFPCLLFGGCESWSRTGYSQLPQITGALRMHDNSVKHMNNVISLQLLGKVNIAESLSGAYRDALRAHNDKVKQNRAILTRLIDAILFCAKHEISLRGHNEGAESSNRGIYRDLLDYTASYDPILKQHLENSGAFKGVSSTIQNDLLDCAFDVYQSEIKREIRASPFLAVMADETTDVSGQSQLVIVFRYLKGPTVVESFWGYFKMIHVDAKSLANVILGELNAVLEGDTEKLIAQTYDGANVMRGSKNGVRTQILDKYPNAHFVHCYAHQLNLIMKNACGLKRGSSLFFAKLNALSSFFSKSPQKKQLLGSYVEKHFPKVCQTRWTCNVRLVMFLSDNIDKVKLCLEDVMENVYHGAIDSEILIGYI